MVVDRPFAASFVAENARVVAALPVAEVLQAAAIIDEVRQRKGRVFLAGNGGSATTASHMACDLMKATSRRGRPAVRVQCLSDQIAAVTAFANDESFDVVFSAQLAVLGEPGDVLVAVSGSGRSPNILAVLEEAKASGLTAIGLLGMGGGPARDLCNLPLIVDSDDYEVIENAHLVIGHLWAAYLREHGDLSA